MNEPVESSKDNLPIEKPDQSITKRGLPEFATVYTFYGGAISTALVLLIDLCQLVYFIFCGFVNGHWLFPDLAFQHIGLKALGMLFVGVLLLKKEPKIAREIFGGRTVDDIAAKWTRKLLRKNEAQPLPPALNRHIEHVEDQSNTEP